MTITCPQCRKDDMIQKVSAVYSGGRASISTSGTGSTPHAVAFYQSHHSQQTDLSRKLAPPPEPSLMSTGMGVEAVFLLGGILELALGIYVEIPYFTVIGGFTTAVGVLLVLGYKKSRGKIELENQKATQEWRSRYNTWNRLYYCARDDCVFDPTNGESAPIDEWHRLYLR